MKLKHCIVMWVAAAANRGLRNPPCMLSPEKLCGQCPGTELELRDLGSLLDQQPDGGSSGSASSLACRRGLLNLPGGALLEQAFESINVQEGVLKSHQGEGEAFTCTGNGTLHPGLHMHKRVQTEPRCAHTNIQGMMPPPELILT